MTRTRDLRRSQWALPDTADLSLEYSIADSVVEEFVLGHRPSDVLTELVQNEFDAGGSKLEVNFGQSSLSVAGNGRPVDSEGWKRLSVMLGRGRVAGSDRVVKPKTNSIGSKNFGLRSLFLFGDEIYIRSGGRQTVLHISRGTLPKPLREPSSRGRNGIQIEVPYRSEPYAGLDPFGPEKEREVLTSFADDLTPILIKLAQPGSTRSLQEVRVSSVRYGTRLHWRQSAKRLKSSRRGIAALQRTVRVRETAADSRSSSTRKLEEIEFQRAYRIPEEYQDHSVPGYFKVRGGATKLGVSVRLQRGKVDSKSSGLFYYPLGLEQGYTGTFVSVNAPFQLDNDRSRVVDPTNSRWNAWLLERAAELTLDVVVSDWLDMFGASAYLVLDDVGHPSASLYRDTIGRLLRERDCWPTRSRRRGRSGSPVFTTAQNIVLPEAKAFDEFLSQERYLDARLANSADVQRLARRCGATEFTMNSLIRLRCAGEDSDSLATSLKEGEANYYFTDFPRPLLQEDLQLRFAGAIDAHSKRLSKDNRTDLKNSATTLTAEGSLEAPSRPLWIVEPTIADVETIPASQRLHPSLMSSRTIIAVSTKFELTAWLRRVAERAQRGDATDEERIALYSYVLSVDGRLDRRTQAMLRRSPVLKDHRGDWVEPQELISRRTASSRRLEAALHFPHRDYSKNIDLARSLRFRDKVNGEDLVHYARVVEQRQELAEGFEETLWRLRTLLTPRVVNDLSTIAFLRSSSGDLMAPETLYIASRINRSCLGDDSVFATGTRAALHKELGCIERPHSADILQHLSTRRESNQPPEQPEVIYPELVNALRTERIPPETYEDQPIIWVKSNYHRPLDVLLGPRHRKNFLQAVPQVTSVRSPFVKALAALGAQAKPQATHWRQLFLWFGEKYNRARRLTPIEERYALRNAYATLDGTGLPEGVPDNCRCLLDREGRVYSKADAEEGRYVEDDDPRMAEAIIDRGLSITFADNRNEALRFYDASGVRPLSAVRVKTGSHVGEERDPPQWYRPDEIDVVHSGYFGSALISLVAHELRQSDSELPISGGADLEGELGVLRRIAFVRDIESEYRISGLRLRISEELSVEPDYVACRWVRSRSEFRGLLSSAIAGLIVSTPSFQRRLADAVYRMLDCSSPREMERFLRSRGVPWTSSDAHDDDVEPEEYADEEEEEQDVDRLREILSDAIANRVGGGGVRGDSGTPAAPTGAGTPSSSVGTVTTPDRSLPSIEDVSPCRANPTDSWAPSSPAAAGRGGRSSSWTPPSPSDNEWETAVGRRGEEIMYREELARVAALGYPAEKVVWTSDDDPGADHDIQSVGNDGEPIWIEVKSSVGRDGRFRWSINEFERAISERTRYILTRVYEADTATPTIKCFRDPIGLLFRDGMRLDVSSLSAEVEPATD